MIFPELVLLWLIGSVVFGLLLTAVWPRYKAWVEKV